MQRIRFRNTIVITLAALLAIGASAMAQEQLDPERAQLFWASRRLAEQKDAVPSGQIAVFTTSFDGGANPVNLGAKVETAMSERLMLSVEAILLTDKSLGTFISVKGFPFDPRSKPLYIGAGVALKQSVEYQLFVGMEVLDNFFVEVKFISDEGRFIADNPYVAAGFTLPF